MSNYDQWKTASPYDDDPDPIEDAEKWLKRNAKYENLEEFSIPLNRPEEYELRNAHFIITALCEFIEDNI